MSGKPLTYDDLQTKLATLLHSKESDELEFKTAKGGFPNSFWETYSSFANTNGGTIVLGVREHNGSLLLDGLDEATTERYRTDFFNMMNNKQKVNLPLVKDADVQTICAGGVYFMFFHIPRADREMRPVYCGQDPYAGSFRRGNDGDYHCLRSEVNSMFADANIANPVDGRILQHYTVADLDMTSIAQYRQLFKLANPDHVWNVLEVEQFLRKLNVLRVDRETRREGITYAGLLMFGTYSAITDCNPNFFPDYQEIQSVDTRWTNRICPDGNWESNLFQFYQRVLPILQNFLPKPFRLEGNQRVSETTAHVAIREALTNTLVHSDYTVNASLCIYKYPNRIVFSNPGTMLIPISQYYKGGESICRNKYLQTIFTFLGFADKAGSGADKIINGWVAQNWKRPCIEELTRPNKVVLTMTMESLYGTSTSTNGATSNVDKGVSLDGNEASSGDKGVSSADTRQRYTPEQLRNKVAECCKQWRTVDEIAEYVNRTQKHLRNNVLPKMQDILEMKYKDSPTHPKQKYRIKQ